MVEVAQEPARIYLQPKCCAEDSYEGRQWCEDDVWECPDSEPTAYVLEATAQAQAAAQEQRIADALAWLRDHIKEVNDDNSYWGGPHKRAYLDAPAILKELTARAALGEQR